MGAEQDVYVRVVRDQHCGLGNSLAELLGQQGRVPTEVGSFAKELQQRYGSIPVLWRTQVVALALTLPLGVHGLTDSEFEVQAFVAVILLGIGGTGLAYLAATSLAGRVGSTRASVSVYISPPVALLLGVLVRNETVAAISIAGAAVVLLGAWLTSRADEAAPETTDV